MTKPADMVQRLKAAAWLADPELQSVLRLLGGHAGQARVVGGLVRDTLLGVEREQSDVDVATELLPEEVSRRAADAGFAVYPTGIEHGTVTVRGSSLVAEVTTLREDIETDGRHAVVRFGRDWVRDASRRDFTMNALYCGPDGTLFDPLGGLNDCVNHRVRFIGDADQRIAEDRLRIYRFFRFSASHGRERFDPHGLAACQRAASGDLSALAAERIGQEMRRMLGLARVAATLRAMVDCRLLDISPATLNLLRAYERRARRPDFATRLAILVAETGPDRIKSLWRLSNDDLAVADAILQAAALFADFRLHEAAYRYPAVLADGLEAATVLFGWSDAGRLAVLEQLQAIEVPKFPVGGSDLLQLGMRPGRVLGAELDRLEQLWIGSGFALDRDALLAKVAITPA